MSASDPISAIRLRLLANSYEPIPVIGPDAPGASPGKRPTLSGWQTVPVTPDAISSWRTGSQRACVNTGLRCGLLAGIDIDVTNQSLSVDLEDLAVTIFGETPLKRVGKAPKVLLCYRFASTGSKMETKEFFLPDSSKAQIEILAQGQQFVAYGIHPETRQEYDWPVAGPDVVPVHDLPEISWDAVRAFLDNATVLIKQAGGKTKDETEGRATAARQVPPLSRPIATLRQAASGDDFFRQVNAAALQNIGPWITALFGDRARQQPGTGAWRVRSADLNRRLEEDLSIHPVEGGRDFGEEKSCSAIDVVIEHGGAADPQQAALWLCEQLRIAPESLGWRQKQIFREPERVQAKAGAINPPAPPSWPEPIDFLADGDLTGAPELKPHHIPAALYDFVRDTAERMGVDPAAVALAAIVSCSAVATDDWRLQPKRLDDTWFEMPRLWGAIVGDPSILKTPVIAACTKPIDALEIAARERHTEAMRTFRQQEVDYKKAVKSAEKGDGPPAGDPPRKPRLQRYMVEGTTVEALSEALRDDDEAKMEAPARKVLVRQDEMSEWVGGMDRYKSGGGGGSDRGAYLRLYNGSRYTVDRVMRGSFAIPNWSACFLGGIQPGPIQKIASNAEEDGLLQRFMYCVPAGQARGQDRRPNHEARKRYEAVIAAMTQLRPTKEFEDGSVTPVTLHEVGHEARESIDNLAELMKGLPDTSPRLFAAYGKWPGLFARLTLTFHLINVADARARQAPAPVLHVVPAETARMAAAYMEQILLPHLQRADALMFATKQTSHARWIAGFILARGKERVAARDIIQAYRDLRAPETRSTLLQVMQTLTMIGWVMPEEPPNPTREPAAWAVNPAVLENFTARAEKERQRRKEAQDRMAKIIRSKAEVIR